jgi:hypothetical protein
MSLLMLTIKPFHHVDVESCWQRCSRVMLAMALSWRLGIARCRCRVMLAMVLPSSDGDGAAEVT